MNGTTAQGGAGPTEEIPMHAPIRLTTLVPDVLDARAPRLVGPRPRRQSRNR